MPHRVPVTRQTRGVLVIKLHSANGLKAADWNGKSDPYVVLTFGRERVRSKTIPKTLNPVWEETIELGTHTLSTVINTPLQINIFDEDNGRRVRELWSNTDDPLGESSSRSGTRLGCLPIDLSERSSLMDRQASQERCLSLIFLTATRVPSLWCASYTSAKLPSPSVRPIL